ncbi:abortive infection protein [Rhizobium leguminosarum bv. trifolii WSM2304]|uniref:Abortive infection protein n=1 Tax=Rhizobium leguminosarum bv. trifolii (strain WSM2304) TaxID=395492 RepID=A0ABF7QTR2_RHILW|nr:ATP-binding protein [Rhizobium leguminosarum]ACI57491.1 abortive infection protein [Rhizobium leguminosarum bv. trifolii WSM2304]
MLYRLEIENFYSIRERQVIDLRPMTPIDDVDGRFSPLWRGTKDRAPKTIAIFGANASGKSTVLKALSFIVQFALHSFSSAANSRIMLDRFNDEEAFGLPCRLAIEIAGIADITHIENPQAAQCRYRYEIEIGGLRTEAAHVLREALHYWPPPNDKKVTLFDRDVSGSVKTTKAFGFAGFRGVIQKVLRPNASLISTLFQLKHPYATAIWQLGSQVYGNIFIERTETADADLAGYYAGNQNHLGWLNREISRIDLGIQQVDVLATSRGHEMQFHHEGLAVPMPLYLESQGTKSFLKIYPILAQVLEFGGIAMIDELDASIHPAILPEILRWFHASDRNPHNAQLWMTCHNASLLDFLTKDEVLFCEKDKSGRSYVYKLSEFVDVSSDDNFYSKYLSGAYGALPNLG